jgi:3-oxoacyl-[acyl-carrier-protein] synthase-3
MSSDALTQINVGIHGVGVFLPEHVRDNSWWPKTTVAAWRDQDTTAMVSAGRAPAKPASDGMARAMAELAALADDPFRGAQQRRVADPEVTALAIETEAARRALVAARVDHEAIGAVLTYSFCPDYINAPNAPALQAALGLPRRCLCIEANATCNSFLVQLTLAQGLIQSGLVRFALLVQSSAVTRQIDPREPSSPWTGDGATAVVVGPVAKGRGILGQAHRVDGVEHRALLWGIPGSRWYEDGRPTHYSEDREAAKRMPLLFPDRAAEALGAALADAGVAALDVEFFACHQPGPWTQRVARDVAGLTNARTIDTFASVGTLSAANVPLTIGLAQERGELRAGDLVAMFSLGSGVTYCATILRWGT